jgi:hypothetical protein
MTMIAVGEPAWVAGAESELDAECRRRLKTVYDALVQYVEINEAMPIHLSELLDFGLIDDPAVLFDPRGIGVGHHGQARLCTPFEVLATDLAGDLVVSDEPYEGRLFVLRADGSIVVRAVNVSEYYGPTSVPKKDEPVDRKELMEPSSGLGVVVDDRDDHVVIQSIIPGYGTIEGGARRINDLRPGDRLINVEGRRVTTQKDLEDFLRTIGPLETYGPMRPEVYVLRGGELLRRRVMVPLNAINARREDTPYIVHHRAQVYLHPAGPGAMGILAEKDPSGGARVTGAVSSEATAKLRIGDVITHVEDTPVDDVDGLNEQIRLHPAGMLVNLRVVREGVESMTVKFKLQPADAQAVARGRFEIHRGRLEADAALAHASGQLTTSVLVMLEEAQGPEAALRWANQAVANPSPQQQLEMPQILEARADLAAKLRRIEEAVVGYDQAAQAWGIPMGTWGARRKKAVMLIESGRLDEARRLTRSWNLSEETHARQAAMDVAYMYAAFGDQGEARRLLESLQAIADTREQATSMLQNLRSVPPMPRSAASQTLDSEVDQLISEMVMAASANEVERLDGLLRRALMGPDVLGREVTSPLMIAAARGHAQAITKLLNAGADANQRYGGWHSRGNTPLVFAAEAGHANIVYLLIQSGADVNCAGGKGQTPLMVAAAQKKTAVVRELLQHGADVNRTVIERDGVPYGGYTALMVAAKNGHEDIVRMLLENGANPELRGTDGMTALMLAETAGHTTVTNLLTTSQR